MFISLVNLLLAAVTSVQAATLPAFTDISSTSPHAEAIVALKQKDILSGYKDNTFRPNHTVNRAEFLKVLTSLLISPEDRASCIKEHGVPFTDVPTDSWFGSFVCAAKAAGYIKGFDDGSFHPAETINIAEASSILAKAFSLTLATTPTTPWYALSVEAVAEAHAIPDDVQATGQALTRGDMADMLWRLKESVTDQSFADASILLAAQCDWFTNDQLPHVDIQEVRRVWFSWINGERQSLGLAPYQEDKELDHSATLWSLHAKSTGSISHKRTGQTAYYDYSLIGKWFASLDLDFKNVDTATFTENIGWGVYACTKNDCTQDLITAIRSTFDMYMSEKTKGGAHYRSIVKPEFRLIGMGIAVDPSTKKYYITTHYGTAITSDPAPVCP